MVNVDKSCEARGHLTASSFVRPPICSAVRTFFSSADSMRERRVHFGLCADDVRNENSHTKQRACSAGIPDWISSRCRRVGPVVEALMGRQPRRCGCPTVRMWRWRPDARQHGCGEDHRPTLRQMMIDGDRWFVCPDMWPGNIVGVATLIPVQDRRT
jgi:hypothetical protein